MEPRRQSAIAAGAVPVTWRETRWVRTHHNHQFRLFFSDAKRDAEVPAEVVYWGQPERTALTPDHDYAYAYITNG